MLPKNQNRTECSRGGAVAVNPVLKPACIERLERRELLTFTVVNTNDAGGGSLRQAILDANGQPGVDLIVFNIPGSGPHTIAPFTPLPTITNAATIDASSEILANGIRGIELSGANQVAPNQGWGLVVTDNSTVIRGLAINRFEFGGIRMGGAFGRIVGCYIGTDPIGLTGLGNGGNGIELTGLLTTVGGTDPADLNIISGNGGNGILVRNDLGSPSTNSIVGNYIGVARNGFSRLGNIGHGVALNASGNYVGTLPGGDATPATRNIISGNDGDGVRIEKTIDQGIGDDGRSGFAFFGPEANDNIVAGNYIGLTSAGTNAVGNDHGVQVINGLRNRIGSTAPAGGNYLSGNGIRGVNITSNSFEDLLGVSTDNIVIGNVIGLSVLTEPRGNLQGGVRIELESDGNRVGGTTTGERNVISANGGPGVAILNGPFFTTVVGNYIGTNEVASFARPNAQAGVLIDGANFNQIGGLTPAERNVISGNNGDGVRVIRTSGAFFETSARIEGNYIGLNAAGTAGIANTQYGVRLAGAANTRIGDAPPESGNVISGNGLGGVAIGAVPTDQFPFGVTQGNTVQSNRIGTNAAGNAAVPNNGPGIFVTEIDVVPTSGNTIGGIAFGGTPAGGNLISGNGITGGNASGGIRIENGPSNTGVYANRIGTDAAGAAVLGVFGNNGPGIYVFNADGVAIGFSGFGGGRNVIAGSNGNGIALVGDSTVNATVAANAIGTDLTGTLDLGNGGAGIVVSGNSNAIDRNITIGGAADADGNRIAFNSVAGIAVLTGRGVEITRNRLEANGGLGIDLNNDGITLNDNFDTDVGPNELQNFPGITGATVAGGNVTISTVYSGAANMTVRLDYYAILGNPDPSSFGEGEVFLGSATVTTNNVGSAGANPTFSLAGAPGATHISATATRTSDGSTSEFTLNQQLLPDNAAPRVVAATFLVNTDPQSVSFTFSENVSASLSVADLLLENLTVGQTIPSGNIALAYDANTNTATFTFPGYPFGALPDGNYRATLIAAGITDAAGNVLDGDGNGTPGGNRVFEFFFLNGDANRDRNVNLADFNILRANFGASGKTFSQGDFTYDGVVNLADFNILRSKFGTFLPPPSNDGFGGDDGDGDDGGDDVL